MYSLTTTKLSRIRAALVIYYEPLFVPTTLWLVGCEVSREVVTLLKCLRVSPFVCPFVSKSPPYKKYVLTFCSCLLEFALLRLEVGLDN